MAATNVVGGRGDSHAGSGWEAVIGLEVHAQLATRTKMFCRCETRFGAPPNTLVCPVCLALPGALPTINREAVRHALRVVLACGCDVARTTKFDRKNYFYPDLPKGYQISQFDQPIGDGGRVRYELDGEQRSVRLARIHMEEDAGKNTHVAGRQVSQVDLNRAGVPLLEIVTEPDIATPADAVAFFGALRLMLLYLGVCDGNMEEGSLRCDCNVSIRPRGSLELGTRAEIKNLNSFTFIENALHYEIVRQVRVRESGGAIVQETRLYDPDRDETRSMRGKEEAHDYRYFPEPDLPPLSFSADEIEAARASVPEMPLERAARLVGELGLSEYHAGVLVQDHEASRFLDRCLELWPEPKPLANWLINDLKEELNHRKAGLVALGLDPQRFVDLVRAVDDGIVSKQQGRELVRKLFDGDAPIAALIRELGFEQIRDDSVLRAQIESVLADHPGPVDDVRAGKKNSINFLVGQVMRASKGKADAARVAQLIEEILGR